MATIVPEFDYEECGDVPADTASGGPAREDVPTPDTKPILEPQPNATPASAAVKPKYKRSSARKNAAANKNPYDAISRDAHLVKLSATPAGEPQPVPSSSALAADLSPSKIEVHEPSRQDLLPHTSLPQAQSREDDEEEPRQSSLSAMDQFEYRRRRLAYQAMLTLLEEGASSPEQLTKVTAMLSGEELLQIALERALAGLCGNPLCRQAHNPVAATQVLWHADPTRVQRSDGSNFCSAACKTVITAYAVQLGDPMQRLKPSVREMLASHRPRTTTRAATASFGGDAGTHTASVSPAAGATASDGARAAVTTNPDELVEVAAQGGGVVTMLAEIRERSPAELSPPAAVASGTHHWAGALSDAVPAAAGAATRPVSSGTVEGYTPRGRQATAQAGHKHIKGTAAMIKVPASTPAVEPSEAPGPVAAAGRQAGSGDLPDATNANAGGAAGAALGEVCVSDVAQHVSTAEVTPASSTTSTSPVGKDLLAFVKDVGADASSATAPPAATSSSAFAGATEVFGPAGANGASTDASPAHAITARSSSASVHSSGSSSSGTSGGFFSAASAEGSVGTPESSQEPRRRLGPDGLLRSSLKKREPRTSVGDSPEFQDASAVELKQVSWAEEWEYQDAPQYHQRHGWLHGAISAHKVAQRPAAVPAATTTATAAAAAAAVAAAAAAPPVAESFAELSEEERLGVLAGWWSALADDSSQGTEQAMPFIEPSDMPPHTPMPPAALSAGTATTATTAPGSSSEHDVTCREGGEAPVVLHFSIEGSGSGGAGPAGAMGVLQVATPAELDDGGAGSGEVAAPGPAALPAALRMWFPPAAGGVGISLAGRHGRPNATAVRHHDIIRAHGCDLPGPGSTDAAGSRSVVRPAAGHVKASNASQDRASEATNAGATAIASTAVSAASDTPVSAARTAVTLRPGPEMIFQKRPQPESASAAEVASAATAASASSTAIPAAPEPITSSSGSAAAGAAARKFAPLRPPRRGVMMLDAPGGGSGGSKPASATHGVTHCDISSKHNEPEQTTAPATVSTPHTGVASATTVATTDASRPQRDSRPTGRRQNVVTIRSDKSLAADAAAAKALAAVSAHSAESRGAPRQRPQHDEGHEDSDGDSSPDDDDDDEGEVHDVEDDDDVEAWHDDTGLGKDVDTDFNAAVGPGHNRLHGAPHAKGNGAASVWGTDIEAVEGEFDGLDASPADDEQDERYYQQLLEQLGDVSLLARRRAARAKAKGLADGTDPCATATARDGTSGTAARSAPPAPAKDLDDEDGGDDDDGDFEEGGVMATAPFFGPPPAGFQVEISSFGLLWSLLGDWVTNATVAYVTGGVGLKVAAATTPADLPHGGVIGDSAELNEMLCNPAREHLQVRTSLSEFLSQALVPLASSLRLQVPLDDVRRKLGSLLKTLTLTGPVPALVPPQWQLLTAVLLKALSVHHLPALRQSVFGVEAAAGQDRLRSFLGSVECTEPLFEWLAARLTGAISV